MVRVEATENFTLEAFDELKNLERKSGGVKGQLNTGDTFDCTEEMAKYLMGENKLNKVVVKVIEVKPEKETEPVKEVQEVVEDEVSEEVVQAVASAIVEEAEEQDKEVQEIVEEIVEEAKPKKKNNKRAK